MQQPKFRRLSTLPLINVPCPFCSLLCDDLVIHNRAGQLRVEKHGCPKAIAEFERPPTICAPRIRGSDATMEDAVAHIASMLRAAKRPLYSGLGTDVAGMRAVLPLAERTGGVLDHMHGEGIMRHTLALQDSGWMSTTLTEIKNRADLLIFVGTDVIHDYPRFFERVVWNQHSLFGPKPERREIVYLGRQLNTAPGRSPKGRNPLHIDCDIRQLAQIIALIRTLLKGNSIKARRVAGVPTSVLWTLAERMKNARYGVLIWSPASLDFPHADIVIQVLCNLVTDLNNFTRFSGLSLGGNDGSVTATNVCTWQSGYPLRTSFGRGYPEYDPWRYSTDRLLAHRAVDVLIWISSFSARIPPVVPKIPIVVLAVPHLKLRQEPEVFIPVATPGVDHDGQLFRCDGVVALSVRRLRNSPLPSVAKIVAAIYESL
ncbi:MAG: formylmethanofuran dehydrogenase subunit B [Gammaproteobacteria bacterium]|nr:formylmethanofuran dehydrogenase subunit B [Gammaproteobacteria bacterium]MCI0590299.1 formylmethanofuran dehydrogenase subunit B [Gammaproteobacteria bacterium]